jgi:lauroyl/myristoyl acyltransferase
MIEVPLLGRTLPLARGAFALARIADVPIIPIVPRWRGTAIEVEIGEPMRLGADGERGMAEAIAAWIERYLRERPGETSVFMLERLQPPFQAH